MLLCHQLVAARNGVMSQRDAVAAYERAMIDYGFQAVRESLKQMSADEPIHHPVWGGLTRAGMKTFLRVANALPPLRRKLAQGETRLRNRKQHPALVAVGLAADSGSAV